MFLFFFCFTVTFLLALLKTSRGLCICGIIDTEWIETEIVGDKMTGKLHDPSCMHYVSGTCRDLAAAEIKCLTDFNIDISRTIYTDTESKDKICRWVDDVRNLSIFLLNSLDIEDGIMQLWNGYFQCTCTLKHIPSGFQVSVTSVWRWKSPFC